MPRFTEGLESMRDFYRLAFLPDGYPGRVMDDGRVKPHPIYGVYVIEDYLKQYRHRPSAELASAISTVAHAALRRMEEHRGALAFYYDEGWDLARLYERHYSGLTQAYYAVELHRAGEALQDPRLVEGAARVFDSLLIPVEAGGVLHRTSRGPVIAEVPQQPNSWILNGWQSALASVQEYADLSGSEKAQRLLRDSARTMAKVLPLYDAKRLANSRYGLTGFVYLRLRTDATPTRILSARIEVPGEGAFPVPPRSGSRWQNYLFKEDLQPDGVTLLGPSVQMNVVLSRASRPERNLLRFTLDAPEPVTVVVEAYVGRYDPLKSSPIDPRWTEVAKLTARPRASAAVRLPASLVDRVAYPTNFAKEIDGENTNVYHAIHVRRLRELADSTGLDEFDEWADRWEGYICRWASMDIYAGLSVRGTSRVGTQDPQIYCRP
ncbi:MAG: D-glucuronyl C5-epimerase family protein [Egibacteraceae bacterium]